MNAATQSGAAEQGERTKPLTPVEIAEIQQEQHNKRLSALDGIQPHREGGDWTPAGDEDEERQRALAEATGTTEGEHDDDQGADNDATPPDDAARQVQAAKDDEDELVIDLDRARRVRFITKVDGKEEVVPGDKVLARYQKDAAADVRLAQATEAKREAEAKLAEAERRLAEANSAKERKEAESAVNASKEKLASVTKEAMNALYEGDVEKASQLLTSGFTDVVTASLESRGKDPATSDLDVNQLAASIEDRIEVKGALKKLFDAYPEIQADPDYAFLADRARARFLAEGKSHAEAILAAGDEVGKKFGLGKANGTASNGNNSTTLSEKRERKNGIDEIPRAGARVTDGNRPQAETASSVIADMARQRGAQRGAL